jgi:hypothetical protein
VALAARRNQELRQGRAGEAGGCGAKPIGVGLCCQWLEASDGIWKSVAFSTNRGTEIGGEHFRVQNQN